MFNKKFKIQTILNLIVIALTLPITMFFIFVTYSRNEKLTDSYSGDFAVRTTAAVVDSAEALFNPIIAVARSSAALASATPAFFDQEVSADYLWGLVNSNESITSAYIAYSNGALRQVARVTPGTRFFEYEVPAEASVVSRWLQPFQPGVVRQDRIRFHSAWDREVSRLEQATEFDPRVQSFYRTAIARNAPAITDPVFSASSRQLTVSVATPVQSAAGVVGVFSLNISLATLSAFVRDNPVSLNSTTIITDGDGGVIAHPGRDPGLVGGQNAERQPRVAFIRDPAVRGALAARIQSGTDLVTFDAGTPSRQYTALFVRFPPDFQKNWEIMTVTPSDDFLGELHRTRDNIIFLAAIGLLIQLLLINLVSRALSRPIERLAKEVESIRGFDFTAGLPIQTSVTEVAKLRQAVSLLKGALEAFTSYVPRGLVQQLLDSGESIRLGGQGRYLTIFFTDLEGFTTLSETTPVQELLTRVSRYLEVVSKAVNEQHGTIDKFIGDAVMAFWGAPLLRDDHAFRACVAAIQSQRRMAELNAAWEAEGLAPLRVRIGIHCDAVLVGNIGSAERMSYTVLGDGVNIAARLEGINVSAVLRPRP